VVVVFCAVDKPRLPATFLRLFENAGNMNNGNGALWQYPGHWHQSTRRSDQWGVTHCGFWAGSLLLVSFGWNAPGRAQEAPPGYPARPIRIIVPVVPGGGLDMICRSIGQMLTGRWGQGAPARRAELETHPGTPRGADRRRAYNGWCTFDPAQAWGETHSSQASRCRTRSLAILYRALGRGLYLRRTLGQVPI